ncbi:ATP-dependent helicase HrpB [Agrobacterium bohemicum]|uniref:ATP-dependent helicase n=1 Tax=Agrobacterium bohemicum TaxID=2052828 RepID=A0A135P2E6_9HYPH|nr:ATP-dependent helicase HrpB [Agrobacterium bohemicum]KXG85578.1 ATP-dependent helicase [Agrobacterium bohemicum]
MTQIIEQILPTLPVTDVLAEIGVALASHGQAVLSAPPGAGKTTLVPLYLLDQSWRGDGKIILLELRRLAARAAASRMAALLGETVGETVGYRMRLDTRISPKTRIEVVTEGVFARMVLDDPELGGVSAVIFDEFHERSLDGDFGLALALDVQAGLRDDLKIVVMSATLDVERISNLLGEAPVIKSLGRSFPIDIRYDDRPSRERIEDSVARAIIEVHGNEKGSILAFLPGQGEITRTVERLDGRFGPDTHVIPLYGNLSQKEQDAAIKPTEPGKRKIVLATSIAETSITIDGVSVVIDSGLQRLPVFEPSTGMTRLETVKVSRASADQRAGRAGRTEPGIAIRLWHTGQTAALAAFTPPQILASDLSALALDLAHWGVTDPASLAFLDQPPQSALIEARALLTSLGALDASMTITPRGKKMRELAMPPRLSAMVIAAQEAGHGNDAAMLAVILTEQGLGGSDIDLEERLRRFKYEKGERATAAKSLAKRIVLSLGGRVRDASADTVTAGELLLRAYPDRIAFQRGGRGRYVMANGRGAELAETERLATEKMLVVADVTGRAAQPRILAAASIGREDVEEHVPDAVRTEDQLFFEKASGQVRARRVTRIGAIVLEETPLGKPSGEKAALALANGIREHGLVILTFSKEAQQLRQRLGFLHRTIGDPWPDTCNEALVGRLDEWFVPYQHDARSIQEIRSGGIMDGLLSLVPHSAQRELTKLLPTHFEAPTGQKHPISYDGDEPTLTIRVQELFGLKQHPSVAGGKLPLLLELTSPAHRPIQTTRDLPGFWAGSWKDVRADMRGRYPRHPWPEDPASALPTNRVKPRGT